MKRIHLAGDNDIGGEAEPIEAHLLTRHEKHFGPTNEIIKFDNWQFVKVLDIWAKFCIHYFKQVLSKTGNVGAGNCLKYCLQCKCLRMLARTN